MRLDLVPPSATFLPSGMLPRERLAVALREADLLRRPLRAVGRPDPLDSPALLLATLFSARRSRDAVLEQLVFRRLADMGIRVQFAGSLDAITLPRGGDRG